MTVKPIDIQTNIGQMHEVARQSHAQNESLIAQMHHLDKEAKDKGVNADSRLEEADKSQEAANRLDSESEGQSRRHERHGGKKRGPKGEEEIPEHIEIVREQNLGRFIDVKK
jgi:hypothetical protein